MSNAKRVPRPMGTTTLMQEYVKTGDAKCLDLLFSNYINHWVTHQNNMFGVRLNTMQLAEYLGVEVSRIHEQLTNQFLNNKIFQQDRAQEIVEKLIGQSVAWAIEDRMDVQGQVDLLRNSQGDKYVPFISAEVTKALALKLSSSNSLQSLVKQLQGGSTVNIFNQQNNIDNSNNVHITVEDAMGLIQSQMELTSPQTIGIVEANIVEDNILIPEVVATKQYNTEASEAKEGLHINRSELRQIVDDYKGAIEEAEELHHDVRREIELLVDENEIDPEVEYY